MATCDNEAKHAAACLKHMNQLQRDGHSQPALDRARQDYADAKENLLSCYSGEDSTTFDGKAHELWACQQIMKWV